MGLQTWGHSLAQEYDETFEADFTKANTPAMTLKKLYPEDVVREIVVEITEVFDPGITVSVGVPANHDAVFAAADIDAQTVGLYKAFPYRESAATETLALYISAASATGAGKVYILF